jgi:biopolymer transport protein ExbD
MNVTPMIDVLLVLLIICIVVLTWRHVLPVEVPPAGAASAAAERAQLVLHVGPGGVFTLNGQPVPATALESHLREVMRDRPAPLLFVAADPAVPYHAVIGALDRARGAGVEVLALMPAER